MVSAGFRHNWGAMLSRGFRHNGAAMLSRGFGHHRSPSRRNDCGRDWFAWLAAALSLSHAVAVAEPARACEARVNVAPVEAFVGERVMHEIVITGVAARTTVEWLHPPRFPDTKATRLLPPVPRGDDLPGTRREIRALHPMREGRVVLPATPFLCQPASGGPTTQGTTPATVIDVRPVPDAGRPPSWRGLVGATTAQLRSPPTSMHVGESVALQLLITSEGRVRQAAFDWPLAELAAQAPAPELLATRARQADQSGARAVGRRTETLEIIPHETGELRVPRIEVSTWLPREARWATATTEAFVIDVRTKQQSKAGAHSTPGADDPSQRGDGPGLHGVAWLLMTAAGVLVSWHMLRRSRKGDRGDAGADKDEG